MADQLNNEFQPDPHAILRQRRRRSPSALVFTTALAIPAAAAAYLWLNHDRLVQAVSSAVRPAAIAAPVVGNREETVALKDFQSFQQHTNDAMQSTTQGIAALQGSLKTLSDQVSALSARTDALQSAAAPAPTQSVVPAVPAAPARRVVAAPKRPHTSRPGGPISLGGAPLPSEPAPAADSGR